MGLPSKYLSNKISALSLWVWENIRGAQEGVDESIEGDGAFHFVFVQHLWPTLLLTVFLLAMAVVLVTLSAAFTIASLVDYIGGLRGVKE